MKKDLITFIFIAMLPLGMHANEVTPGIAVNKTDGNSTSLAICELRSIKFSGGYMVVNMKDDSQQTFVIDEVATVAFVDLATAINVLSNRNVSNSNICIVDISGRMVYDGKAADAQHVKLSDGIYVIIANGKNHKVMINNSTRESK